MRCFLILGFIIISVLFVSSDDFDSISTILVVCEETENGNFVVESPAFTSGVLDALWDRDYIFFETKTTEPLKIIYNQIDIRPYFEEMRSSGADSVLLLKFNYSTESIGTKIKLTANEVFFNLYSLIEMKSIRVGKNMLKVDETIETDAKNSFLKRLGYETLNSIYK